MTMIFSAVWVLSSFVLSHAETSWPPSNPTDPQLMGVFFNVSNQTQSSTWSDHARALFQSAIVLSRRYNITFQGRSLGWHAVGTQGQSMAGLGSICERLGESDVVGIVGPALSQEAHIIATFASVIGIPVVSYAATDPGLSDINAYPTFHRTVPSDNTAALAIAQLFVQFNWSSAIVIYENDAYGSGGAKALDETFSRMNLIIADVILFDITTLAIRGNLKNLLTRSDTRVVILWMQPSYARRVIENALRDDLLAPQFTWILSAVISLDYFNASAADQLSGMLSVEPVVGSAVAAPVNGTLLAAAYDIWKQYEPETFPGVENVENYALFAFDATWTLINALANLCSNVSSSCLSFVGDSFCFNRRFVHSDVLLDIVERTSFRGVTGPVVFTNSTTNRHDGSYYIARNVQRVLNGLYHTPVLVWSNTNGWTRNEQTSVIIWPDGSLKVPSGHSALDGVKMRIAVIEVAPFMSLTEVTDDSGAVSTKHIGYIPDLIAELQSKLGFIPQITYHSSEQSYNDLVNAVANGTFDLFVGDVTITAARREKVAYSSAIFDNSLRVIVRESTDTELELWSFLKPLSSQVWLTVLGTTVYAGLIVWLLERHQNFELRERSSWSQIGMSMWYSLGTVMGFGVEFKVTTAAGRLLTIGLYIVSLILVAAYTANLASNLSSSKSIGSISGIESIKNGDIPFNRIGILRDTSIEEYYLREISGGKRDYYPLEAVNDLFIALINDSIDASIMDGGTLEYAVGSTYCNLTLVGANFDRSAYGIAYQKDWLHQQDLDVAILSLRESGTLDTLKAKWFQTNACTISDSGSVPMTLGSMAGLFLTFAVINALAFVWFLWRKRAKFVGRLRGCKPPSDGDAIPMETPIVTVACSTPRRKATSIFSTMYL